MPVGSEGSGASGGLTRRSPLDGLRPLDFVVRNWPHGKLRAPREHFESYGLDRAQVRALMRGVALLRQLALDYKLYLEVRDIAQERLAVEFGISDNTLRALAKGTAWPSTRTVLVLRANIPDAERLADGVWEIDPPAKRAT